jgi:hypothetical protein
MIRKLKVAGVVATVAVLSCTPLSVQWSPEKTLSVSLSRADARIGRPLTPMSVAGVNRRVNRRAYYGAAVAAGAIGAGAYYGGYYGGYQPSSSNQYYDYYQTQATPTANASWCAARFRSFNPATGTYRGYDGLDHPCP